MEDHQIIITRAQAVFGCALKHAVEIDGLSVGVLKNGGTLVIHTTPGAHALSFLSHGKVVKSLSILVEPGCHTMNLTAKLSGTQKLEVMQECGASRPNTASPPESQPRPKKRGPALLIAGIALVSLIAIGIIGAIGTGDPIDRQPSISPVVELTDEEKAVAELEKATAKFQDGDYLSALELCNEISANYPTTQVAANMSGYLKEQYSSFDTFSAETLMSEYDANVVNADETYTDTTMIVTGTVSSIGKTNSGSNLTVMLNSGTYFYGVQLNFDTSQTESVAALREGGSVAAIGKCTGKSGKQLIVLDGNNVMIEDCLLIVD